MREERLPCAKHAFSDKQLWTTAKLPVGTTYWWYNSIYLEVSQSRRSAGKESAGPRFSCNINPNQGIWQGSLFTWSDCFCRQISRLQSFELLRQVHAILASAFPCSDITTVLSVARRNSISTFGHAMTLAIAWESPTWEGIACHLPKGSPAALWSSANSLKQACSRACRLQFHTLSVWISKF